MPAVCSCLLLFIIIMVLLNTALPYPHDIIVEYRSSPRSDLGCRSCSLGENCYEVPLGGCPYGVFLDRCNFVNCHMGPGDTCDDTLKLCATSLSCRCGKCSGCMTLPTGQRCPPPVEFSSKCVTRARLRPRIQRSHGMQESVD